jgi:catechol 2,3-dioxygenase-like lactoylglutathione lyase family enzyme
VGRVIGLDHVQLAAPAGCEAEARRFYGGLLGMDEIEKPPELRARGGLWFRCGAQQLHVGVDPGFAPALKAHPALAVEGLEQLLDTLAQAGATVTTDGARVYTPDPWGNRLELVAATSSSTPAEPHGV